MSAAVPPDDDGARRTELVDAFMSRLPGSPDGTVSRADLRARVMATIDAFLDACRDDPELRNQVLGEVTELWEDVL